MTSTNPWRESGFTIGMPQMVPGKLSEVELLKFLGDTQWESIAALLDQKSSQIANAADERLYASFINIELRFAGEEGQHAFGEGAQVFLANRVNVYAKKFIEGVFLFGSSPLSARDKESARGRADLERVGCGWAYLTNAFVARFASNNLLKISEPAAMSTREIPQITELPIGISEHEAVQFSGRIEGVFQGKALALRASNGLPIEYEIVPESDLNGAGLLYFARYVAIMNYGERLFLSERLDKPWSRQLISTLSTEHRKIYYFGNAEAFDSLRISVTPFLVFDESVSAGTAADARGPLQFLFRIDLHRVSDSVLIASSLVRKSLRVPPREKALVAESRRILVDARQSTPSDFS